MQTLRWMSLALTASAIVGCDSRPPLPVDPCQAATFNAEACQAAVTAHGYYWYGVWHPVVYPYEFGYYSNAYRGFVVGGGVVTRSSASYYSSSYSAGSGSRSLGSDLSGSNGTVRGGFGTTAASHASGGFGE